MSLYVLSSNPLLFVHAAHTPSHSPSTFLHGYATASYQIEGGHDADGKGPSIWDEFVLRPGKINDGETGAMADDSYNLYKEDIALLKQFSSNAYRFSIAWSRVIPLGGRADPVNELGLQYYDKVIDECLANGIVPMVTLYHWDLPAALHHRYGGWLNTEEVSADFERYAAVCFARFGDRVKHWITLNEPWCACSWGYATGWMAPGHSAADPHGDPKTEPFRVGHSLLISHAKAVKVYREMYKPSQKGQIGITLNCDWAEPFDNSPKTLENVQRRLDALLGWFAEPIYGSGDYPASFKKLLGDRLPSFTSEESELIYRSSDFFGLNSYTTNLVTSEENDEEWWGGVAHVQVRADGTLLGQQGEAPWLQDYPAGFRALLRYINKEFIRDSGLVILVTEQGYPVFREYNLSLEEIIDDKTRQAYFAGYLKEVLGAVVEDKIKIGAYMAWTLTDNFEWAAGYNQRFGSAYVDHENGNKRIAKDSGKWLGRWFKANIATNHPIRSQPKEAPGALNKYSRTFTDNAENGGAKAMLWATGVFKDETDMAKPQIGVSAVWWEGNPCNQHLLGLAQKVKEGCELEGLIGFMHSVPGVSDGMTQGNLGMKYSLPSRDLIADSIELIVTAQAYDGNISIPGCDKNMPGVLMAAVRHNKPTLIVYGGTIRAGVRGVDCPSLGAKAGDPLTIGDAFESYGAYLKGTITQEERDDVIRHACPGVGACGGQFTANSMSSCLEVLGMSLPYSASTPAVWPEKQQECLRAAKYMRNLLIKDIKPSDILTKKSFENAIVVMNLTGGSTNSVLHLLAMARCANIDLTVDDFQRIADKTPYIADLKPSGKYVMEDLHNVGGIPALLKYILKETDLIDGTQLTVTGLSLAENVADAPDLDFAAQDVIRPLSSPIKTTGHLTILRGNLAPNSAVAKITGKEGTVFKGTAMCFDDEESFYPALQSGKISPGTAVILRYQGPKGAPGMPEMLGPTGAMIGANLANTCCLITDGRFSGASRGFIVGHVCPEACMGGPIALVKDGDEIIVDSLSKNIEVVVSDEEMTKRRAAWVKPADKFTRGVLFRYARDVQGAEYGPNRNGSDSDSSSSSSIHQFHFDRVFHSPPPRRESLDALQTPRSSKATVLLDPNANGGVPEAQTRITPVRAQISKDADMAKSKGSWEEEREMSLSKRLSLSPTSSTLPERYLKNMLATPAATPSPAYQFPNQPSQGDWHLPPLTDSHSSPSPFPETPTSPRESSRIPYHLSFLLDEDMISPFANLPDPPSSPVPISVPSNPTSGISIHIRRADGSEILLGKVALNLAGELGQFSLVMRSSAGISIDGTIREIGSTFATNERRGTVVPGQQATISQEGGESRSESLIQEEWEINVRPVDPTISPTKGKMSWADSFRNEHPPLPANNFSRSNGIPTPPISPIRTFSKRFGSTVAFPGGEGDPNERTLERTNTSRRSSKSQFRRPSTAPKWKRSGSVFSDVRTAQSRQTNETGEGKTDLELDWEYEYGAVAVPKSPQHGKTKKGSNLGGKVESHWSDTDQEGNTEDEGGF